MTNTVLTATHSDFERLDRLGRRVGLRASIERNDGGGVMIVTQPTRDGKNYQSVTVVMVEDAQASSLLAQKVHEARTRALANKKLFRLESAK